MAATQAGNQAIILTAAEEVTASPVPFDASQDYDRLHDQDKDANAADIVDQLFQLPDQRLIEDFSCAVSEAFVLHGRMYITEDAVCFYSNLLGKETRKIIPFDAIVQIIKRNAAVLFPALEFVIQPKAGGEKRVLFTSFFGKYREECFHICRDLHRQHRPELYADSPGTADAARDASYSPCLSESPLTYGQLEEQNRKRSESLPARSVSRRLSATPSESSETAAVGGVSVGTGTGACVSPRAAANSLPLPLHPHHHAAPTGGDKYTSPPAAAPLAPTASTSASGGNAAVAAAVHGIASSPPRPHSQTSPSLLPGGGAAVVARLASSSSSSVASASASVSAEVAVSGPAPPALWARISKMKVVCDVVLPLSAARFYTCFVGSQASLSLAEAHRAAGHYNIVDGPWEKTRDRSGSSDSQHESAAATSGVREAFVTRTLRFTMPLDPAPFTPKETGVEQVQRLTRYADDITILDSSSRSFDVPYGDYFETRDNWILVPLATRVPIAGHETAPPAALQKARGAVAEAGCNPADAEYCRFIVSLEVSFSKYTMFKNTILTRTEEGTGHFYRGVLERMMAHALTKLDIAPRPASSVPSALSTSHFQGGAFVSADFMSPTMAAAMSNDSLRIPRDAVMATWSSPTHATRMDKDELLRQYTQLYTSHEVVLGQVRRLQAVTENQPRLEEPAALTPLSTGTAAGAVGRFSQKARAAVSGAWQLLPPLNSWVATLLGFVIVLSVVVVFVPQLSSLRIVDTSIHECACDQSAGDAAHWSSATIDRIANALADKLREPAARFHS